METQSEFPERKPFLTRMDYDKFEREGRDLDASIAVFLVEIREYLNYKWQDKYYIKEPLESLEHLNKDHLLEYPSSGGDAILDDAFTGPDCPLEMFSQSTFEILAYFYNFHMD